MAECREDSLFFGSRACPRNEKCGRKCIWRKRGDIKKFRIETIAEYLDLIMAFRQQGYWSFRGHRELNWQLGVGFRFGGEKRADAARYLEHFKKRSLSLPQHAHLPETDEWRWLFLAQHHGLRTKLLDWSSNPLVALYFAVENIVSAGSDSVGGAVWALKVKKEYFLTPLQAKNPDCELDAEGGIIPNRPKKSWYMVNPPPFTPRIERQSGKFSYHPDPKRSVSEERGNRGHRKWRLILLCVGKEGGKPLTEVNATIRRQLGIMNIHHGSMFPEHSGIAQFINRELDALSPD